MKEIKQRIDQLGVSNYARTGLVSIYGGGACKQPKLALVFMNPTSRNLSSRLSWPGPRFPFVGVYRIWYLLATCDLLSADFVAQLPKSPKAWSVNTAISLQRELISRQLYVTNVIKETAVDSSPPPRAMFAKYETLLHDELAILKPKLTIAFGALAYHSLTGENIRLADAYEQMLDRRDILKVNTRQRQTVVPCYFPVGRGNPERAMTILKMVANEIAIK